MSYILDALKRAEAERARGQVPGLNAQPATAIAPIAPSSALSIRIGIPISVALLALSGAAWWFTRTAPLASSSPAPVHAAQVATPVAAVALPNAAAPHPAQSPIGGMPGLRTTDAPDTAPKTVARPIAVKPVEKTPVDRKPQPSAPTPPAAVTEKADAQRAVTQTPPALAALPDGIRASIPKLTLSGSVYSSNPSQRMLIVNGLVFHEGGSPAPDVTLERIGPTSAVMNFRGTQFSLPY